jgi:leucyl-tRNA synthetase
MRALIDLGFAPSVGPEPFKRLFTQGLIRMDGSKMSKSKGNLVTPEEYYSTVGADALRLFHLFVGPPGENVDWTSQCDEEIEGCRRFLDRIWRFAVESRSSGSVDEGEDSIELRRATHRLIEKVSEDVDRWRYNTAVASLMEFANRLQRYSASHGPGGAAWDEAVDSVLLLLAPMTPHVTAEAWELRHGDGARLHSEAWPIAEPGLARVDRVTMVVQVNGKLVDRIEVDAEINEEDAKRLALGSVRVQEKLDGREPSRVIVRPPTLVNLVAKS